MDKKLLKQMNSINSELEDLNKRIKKIEEKPIKIAKDTVKGSSKEFPYTSHNFTIEGFESPKNLRKYKKMLRKQRSNIEKLCIQLTYELDKMEDSELRRIIRYKYIDNLSFIQIAHKMNENSSKEYTADGIRMQLKRFLENK